MKTAQAIGRGRGLGFVVTGIALLLASAHVHANPYHVKAALVFAVCMLAIRILSDVDTTVLGKPWQIVVHFTDRLTVGFLCIGTFIPLLLVSMKGHPGWDVAVLAGILLLWWAIADELLVDYRRVRYVIATMALAWAPVAALEPPTFEIAGTVLVLAMAAAALTLHAFVRSLKAVPDEYRAMRMKEDLP